MESHVEATDCLDQLQGTNSMKRHGYKQHWYYHSSLFGLLSFVIAHEKNSHLNDIVTVFKESKNRGFSHFSHVYEISISRQ